MNLEWREVRPDARPKGPTIWSSVTRQESEKLARMAKGKTVAEIGTGFGYSAIVMALAGAKVVTADPHEELRGMFGTDSLLKSKVNAKAYGVEDRIEFRVGRGLDVFTRDEQFDGCFVDGDHRWGAVLADAELAEMIVVDGGWIAYHDYGEATCPGVAQALDQHYEGEFGSADVVDTLYVRRR